MSRLDATVDLRSLALCRILTSLVLLYDLLDRCRHLDEHYGSAGLVPLSALRDWSVHQGGSGTLAVVFGVQILMAVGLLLGCRSRVASVACWLLMVSLHMRNPYLLYSADFVLILTLAWGCFVPWGLCWSLDSRGKEALKSPTLSGPLAWVWLAQPATMYLFTALRKSGPSWMDGTALYHALTTHHYQLPLGQLLRELIVAAPWLGQLMTWLALGWEFVVPFLLFSRLRNWAVASIVGFQVGIFLTIDVAIFPVISAAQALGLLSASFWLGRGMVEGEREWTPTPKWVGVLMLSLFSLSWVMGLLSLFEFTRPWRPPVVKSSVRSMRLFQSWNMFAPEPPLNHGWYSVRGTLVDGTQLELLRRDGEAWTAEPPENVIRSVGGLRWAVFCLALYLKEDPRRSALLSDYLQRRFEAEHPEKSLESLEILYFVAPIRPYQEMEFQERVLLKAES